VPQRRLAAAAAAAAAASQKESSHAAGSTTAAAGVARAAATASAAADDSSAAAWQETIISTALQQPSQLVKLVCKAKLKPQDEVVAVVRTAPASPSPLSAQRPDNSSGSSLADVAAGSMPYKQLTLRPVLLRGKLLLQLSLLTARQVRCCAACAARCAH
jgi:hypothetical protein